MDDTLYLERTYAFSGFDAVSDWLKGRLGIAGFAKQARAEFDRGTRGRIFDVALASLGVGLNDVLLAEMVAVYREHKPSIELLPDARTCLDVLRGRGRFGVVTDGPLVSQLGKVSALGLRAWDPEIVFTAGLEEGHCKPSLLPFQEIERRIGCVSRSCVYVADNPTKDFAAPRQLGWMTVRVRRHGGLYAAIPSKDDVDVEMNDLTTLMAALGLESTRNC